MLTLATLGMFGYGTYAIAWAVVDMFTGPRLEIWAEAGSIVFGLLLALSAAFVRVRLPGGLAAAIGALLGLQALEVHDAVHLGTGIPAQVALGVFALALIALAHAGTRNEGISRT